jgi:hypothetical protein
VRWPAPPTAGRVFAYAGVAAGLAASLAGNLASARILKPGEELSLVDWGLAGLPPLFVYLAIEVAARNPWSGTPWALPVRRAMLWGLAPSAGIISFVHLVHLGMDGKAWEVHPPGRAVDWVAVLNWVPALLLPVVIDGLLVGSAAALLLPKNPAMASASEGGPAVEPPRAESVPGPAELVSTERPARSRPAPKPKVAGRRVEHPAFAQFLRDAEEGRRWSTGDMKRALAAHGQNVNDNAARAQLSRWNRKVGV